MVEQHVSVHNQLRTHELAQVSKSAHLNALKNSEAWHSLEQQNHHEQLISAPAEVARRRALKTFPELLD